MARNGAGTYSLPAGNPVTTGTTISSTWANNTLSDIATTLTASLAYDGQTNPVANLPMAGYNHTNVGVATNRTNYAQAGQVQDGTYSTLTGISGTDTITAFAAINLTTYVAGQYFNFVSAGANTTTSVTLNINGIGAKNITKNGSTALSIGDIASGQMISVIYDGTQFQLQTGVLGVTSFSAGTTGLTPSSLTKGSVTLAGTLNVANGGTGSTTLTANNVLLGNGTSAVQTVAPGTSGQALVSNGTTWSASTIPGTLININYYTTAGTATYTKTTNNPSYIIVEVQGAGAGASSGNGTFSGASGGGGAYARKKILASSLSTNTTITVGAGTAANTSTTAGTSSFGSVITCTGGTGPGATNSSPSSTNSTATGGDINIRGGLGNKGGTSGAPCTPGGWSMLGGVAGFNQTGIYGGGAGGNATGSSTAAGGDGIVIVYEYS